MSARGGNGRDDESPTTEAPDAESGGEATSSGSETKAPGPDEGAPDPDATGTASDETGGAEGLPEGLQELPPTREQLEALRRERDEAKDALLRRRAEFENFKKRTEREQQAVAVEAASAVLRRLLETVDNLERALAAAPGAEDALRHGVELTLHDLQVALEAQGVQAVDPRGARFDPQQHQALLHEPVAGVAAGVVAEVLRKGYLYKERLLRPALVKVSSGEDPVDDGGSGEVQ